MSPLSDGVWYSSESSDSISPPAWRRTKHVEKLFTLDDLDSSGPWVVQRTYRRDAPIKIALWHLDVPVSKQNYASLFWRKLKDHRQNRGLGGAEMVKPRYHPVPWSFVSFLLVLRNSKHQDKRKLSRSNFQTAPFDTPPPRRRTTQGA